MTASLSARNTTRIAYSTGASKDIASRAEAYRILNPAEVQWLDSELFSGRRSTWFVVLAPGFGDNAFPVEPDEIARALAGRATVAAIGRPGLNHLLTRELTRDLAVPVGGARFFRPGLVVHDDPALHPAVNPRDDALSSLTAFRDFAVEAMSPANDPVEQLRDLKAELVTARRLLRQRTAATAAESSGDTAAFPTLFSDPTEQFMHDVYTMWLQLTVANEADRATYPLVYDLGPQFVQSVNDLVRTGLVTRERVLRICALVASGQADKIKDTHRLRISEQHRGQFTSYVSREDGAMAYRCPVQSNTPAAARLHYWLQDGGVPELSLLVRHDDNKIV